MDKITTMLTLSPKWSVDESNQGRRLNINNILNGSYRHESFAAVYTLISDCFVSIKLGESDFIAKMVNLFLIDNNKTLNKISSPRLKRGEEYYRIINLYMCH